MRLSRLWNKIAAYLARQNPSSAIRGEPQRGILFYLDNLMALITRWLNNIGMIFISLLMFLITGDVILRWSINSPIRGVNELAEFSMLLVVFLTLGLTQFKKSNVSVDIIFVRFPVRVQNILNIFTCLLCLGISALMLRQSLLYNIYLAEINRKSVILHIPLSPVQVVMVIGFAVLCLVLLVQLIDYTRKAVKG